jgi:hypothetical protein
MRTWVLPILPQRFFGFAYWTALVRKTELFGAITVFDSKLKPFIELHCFAPLALCSSSPSACGLPW